jgi:diadenosine tetraphosphatase ApaH/serine/threonine PP2A family protein phosphatase
LIRSRCSLVVKGNHDSGVLGETPLEHFNAYGQAGIRWTREKISAENMEFLRLLPLLSEVDDMTLVHSSPVNPPEWTYVLTLEEARKAFSAFTTTHCFIGHTHLPVTIGEDLSLNVHRKGTRHIINVGSVGQPRDGNPASSFGLFDSKSTEYTLHRVPYDVKPVIKAIRGARLPAFLGKRLLRGI